MDNILQLTHSPVIDQRFWMEMINFNPYEEKRKRIEFFNSQDLCCDIQENSLPCEGFVKERNETNLPKPYHWVPC